MVNENELLCIPINTLLCDKKAHFWISVAYSNYYEGILDGQARLRRETGDMERILDD